MRRLALLLLILTAFGCKSTKKLKQATSELYVSEVAAFAIDTTRFESLSIQTTTRLEETFEEVETKYQAIDSAGTTIIKPITVVRRRQTNQHADHRQEDSLETRGSIDSTSDRSTTSIESTVQDKASEGADVIEQAATALFPTWGKILASILVAVVPVVWAWWRKKQEGD